MKKILFLLTFTFLISEGYSQKLDSLQIRMHQIDQKINNYYFGSSDIIKPRGVDMPLNDFSLGKLINYKDTTAKLSDFQNNHRRLVLLIFWSTHCGSCIEDFPKEDSLQHLFHNDIQIILVCSEFEKTVSDFISGWEKRMHHKLSLPIVVEDTTLIQYFPHHYLGDFIWIAPDNIFEAESSSFLLNKDIIEAYIKHIPEIMNERSFYPYKEN